MFLSLDSSIYFLSSWVPGTSLLQPSSLVSYWRKATLPPLTECSHTSCSTIDKPPWTSTFFYFLRLRYYSPTPSSLPLVWCIHLYPHYTLVTKSHPPLLSPIHSSLGPSHHLLPPQRRATLASPHLRSSTTLRTTIPPPLPFTILWNQQNNLNTSQLCKYYSHRLANHGDPHPPIISSTWHESNSHKKQDTPVQPLIISIHMYSITMRTYQI